MNTDTEEMTAINHFFLLGHFFFVKVDVSLIIIGP